MILRNDLRPADAPQGLDVFQLTTSPCSACHLSMEAQIFTPDSQRFLLHEMVTGLAANGLA